MSADVLETTRHDVGVVVLELSRPEARNALNTELRQRLVDVLADLAVDDDVLAVVLHGAGGTFCAGFDLKELAAAGDAAEVFAHATTYHHAVFNFTKPLVAAIEGAAVAGGMDLALMCDLRVAASDATFGQPQVKLAIPAAIDLMATVVSGPVARDLCLTGRIVGAGEAARLGLVDRLVEPGASLVAAVELAREIAASAGAGAMKRVFVDAQPDLFE